MALFEYEKPGTKETIFTATDEQVRELINDMSEQSSTVTDDDVPSSENPQGFEPAGGKLFDEGIEISADIIVSVADKLISNLIAKYALDDPEKFYASEKDLKDISTPLEIYFKENKTRIPPWAIALGAASMIMFQKITLAKALREKNIENKKQANEIERLSRELDILKKSREIQDLKKEIETIAPTV